MFKKIKIEDCLTRDPPRSVIMDGDILTRSGSYSQSQWRSLFQQILDNPLLQIYTGQCFYWQKHLGVPICIHLPCAAYDSINPEKLPYLFERVMTGFDEEGKPACYQVEGLSSECEKKMQEYENESLLFPAVRLLCASPIVEGVFPSEIYEYIPEGKAIVMPGSDPFWNILWKQPYYRSFGTMPVGSESPESLAQQDFVRSLAAKVKRLYLYVMTAQIYQKNYYSSFLAWL